MPPRPVIVGWVVALLLVFAASYQPSLGTRDGGKVDLGDMSAGSAMPVIISLVLLAAALWVILSRKYAPTDKHWAFGTVGTIAGFWLHS